MTSHLGDPTSGGTRLILSLVKGLTTIGTQATVVSLRTTESARATLERLGVPLVSSKFTSGKVRFGPMALTRISKTASELGRISKSVRGADWKLLVSDDAIACARQLPGDNLAYLSNGAFPLLFLNQSYYRSQGVIKRVLSLDTSGIVRQNASYLHLYKVLLANSKCCRALMSFIYGIPFGDVIYPPIDRELFCPGKITPTSNYVLAIARNNSENGIELLHALARKVPLKLVGGAKVPNADCKGVVSDSELVDLYRNAAFVAFQPISEYFGYPVAEAQACGTPSLAFASCGPAEQISEGVNGWLARTRAEFLDRAAEIFSLGTSPELRSRCVAAARTYSIEESAGRLVTSLSQAR